MRTIDADKLSADMYHEAFVKDSDMQKWDSGCWIRYKMFEDVLKAQPAVQPDTTTHDSIPAKTGENGGDGTNGDCISRQPEQRWIPVSERLPRQGQEVICQCRANIIKVLKLDANGDWYQDAEHCYMSGFVVAWILLPELYQGGDGNETRINNRHQS